MANKYKTTLKFEVVVDTEQYIATQREVEDFLRRQAQMLKTAAPPGTAITYDVKSEDVVETDGSSK